MRKTYFSTFELLLLALFSTLIVVANIGLRLPVKVPGHSGVAWMAILVTIRGIVRKPGAAATVGILSGLLAAVVGVGDKGGLDTLLSYIAAGITVDFVLTVAPTSAVSFVMAGLAGNLAKLGMKVALDAWIGIPAGFLVVGRTYPALTHAVFGAVGGFLGSLVLDALRRAGFFATLAGKR